MFAFDNSYARLPDRFYARVAPTKVAEPRIVKVNRPLAELLGVDADKLGADILSGNAIPERADPIALAYAGHQFGHFVPQLGDGRAILLGEVVGKDGKRRDIQLKGAGRTPFSRGGDGRAALGPVLREYIVSEAMHALGVPTTRALAAVTTGEPVFREETLPGAVLVRVAASHIRVGTFQFFAARRDEDAIRTLVSHALARHYPDDVDTGNDALALLKNVALAQADLVSQWLGLGFVHGVMNTDNTAISGETIDYGPCAFLDDFDPMRKFSSIDHGGRYAFAHQPKIALWNLARLAEALLGQIDANEEEAAKMATACLKEFAIRFESAHLRTMRAKLGFLEEKEGDDERIDALMDVLAEHRVDHTNFFRRLPGDDAELPETFAGPWRERLAMEKTEPERRAAAMRKANPAFIPRNHRVEEAIEAATNNGDFSKFETLVRVLERPYDDQPEAAHLMEPPGPSQYEYRTFCGT